jgi:hypothetical protein
MAMSSAPAAEVLATPATTTTELPRVWTSEQWVAYFEANAASLLEVPWDSPERATPEELAEIVDSLRAWQLGETSDGSRLRRAAAKYAAKLGDPAFVDAMNLFIGEEQRHGEELGQFLDSVDVPRKKRDWGDSIFRVFRHLLLRMEVWATVVVMVEVHALIYYAALRRATGSAVLRQVCTQILRDEVPHIRFQCERLAILHRKRPRVVRALTLAFHRVLFTGTTFAVWVAHRRALRAGGCTFRRFWRTVWARMGHAWAATDPRAYRWA